MIKEGFGGTVRVRGEHRRLTDFTLAIPGAPVDG
jgi:hypothetical protein